MHSLAFNSCQVEALDLASSLRSIQEGYNVFFPVGRGDDVFAQSRCWTLPRPLRDRPQSTLRHASDSSEPSFLFELVVDVLLESSQNHPRALIHFLTGLTSCPESTNTAANSASIVVRICISPKMLLHYYVNCNIRTQTSQYQRKLPRDLYEDLKSMVLKSVSVIRMMAYATKTCHQATGALRKQCTAARQVAPLPTTCVMVVKTKPYRTQH